MILRVPGGVVVFSAFLFSLACTQSVAPTRQETVATRGAVVMPFDLDKTHHVFDQRPDGGIESVVALDAKDSASIEQIRTHLQGEAKKFAVGDFSDPVTIHDANMPGVAALSAAASRLVVKYAELPGGASITFSSEDRVVVAAVHDWFAAQVSDHGAHASMH